MTTARSRTLALTRSAATPSTSSATTGGRHVPATGLSTTIDNIPATGSLKPYIGQAKDMSRFLARTQEHQAANPNAAFTFQILQQRIPKADLDRYEQFYISAYGGPTTKTFSGDLSNARNQMTWVRSSAAGGSRGIV
jgi:hypothetical protein